MCLSSISTSTNFRLCCKYLLQSKPNFTESEVLEYILIILHIICLQDNTVRVWQWHIGQLLYTATVVNDTSFDKVSI